VGAPPPSDREAVTIVAGILARCCRRRRRIEPYRTAGEILEGCASRLREGRALSEGQRDYLDRCLLRDRIL